MTNNREVEKRSYASGSLEVAEATGKTVKSGDMLTIDRDTVTVASPIERVLLKYMPIWTLRRGFMDTIYLEPTREALIYQGSFAEPAFELLGAAIPLYRNLIKRLGPYGAAVKDLSVDMSTLSNANLRCTLFDLSADIHIRLERLEASFFRTHEIGQATAYQIIRNCWGAVHDAGSSIMATKHDVLIDIDAQIQDVSYDDLMGRYVTIPPTLIGKARSGVVFYMADDQYHGEIQGNLVLDRLIGQNQGLILKLSATFDAQKIPIDDLPQRVDTYTRQFLDWLGLTLNREGT